MAVIKPMKALMYTQKAGNINKCTCPPYDIISPEQRAALISLNPYNMVRLELPEGENRYADAKLLLDEMLAGGIIEQDSEEAIYVYREEFKADGIDYFFTGLICRVKLCEFSEKVVLPHEETLSKAKKDRFELMKATNCNFSSIYSLYTDGKEIKAIMDKSVQSSPLIDFTDDEDVTHRLWKITDADKLLLLEKHFAPKQLFIADGHHRYETALNYKKHLAEQGISMPGADYIMMTLVDMDDPGLIVFPTHRLITGINIDIDELKTKCGEMFDFCECGDAEQAAKLLENHKDKHAYVLYTGGGAFTLITAKDGVGSDIIDGHCAAYSTLDVSVLHTYILEKALGIDKENMAGQRNLRYTRSKREAIEKVDSGEFTACFLMNATKIEQIKDVSLAGDKMPQKSTYFYPKLKTGLVINKLN